MIKGVGLVTASLTGADQYTGDTPGVVVASTSDKGIRIKGFFNLSISGTWAGKVSLERSYDNGVSWKVINTYTSNIETWDQEIESGILYRAGIAAGDYTSGTADVRISK